MRHVRFQILIGLVAILCVSSDGFAQQNEPPGVLAIRKIVHEMDAAASKWKTIGTDDACEGDGCSNTTVWLDSDQRVRKIVTSGSGGPAASNEWGKSHTESYYDPNGNLIFRYSRGENFKGQQRVLQHEGRIYLKDRNLMAWKSDDQWHDNSDPLWGQTQIEILSVGDSELAQARDDLKRRPSPSH
jgi:hypothetical protein